VKRHRAGSLSESIVPLLDSEARGSQGKRASAIYMHYRYSIESLSEIIDRVSSPSLRGTMLYIYSRPRPQDDRASLAELHSILTNDQPGAEGYTTPTRDDDAKHSRSERRRSLPTRSSSLSLASQFNLSGPSSPEMASFQARRRQAAKLTHFFGVDYRVLIGDILESIEHDVQEESHRGSLHPEEIQVCPLFIYFYFGRERVAELNLRLVGPVGQAAQPKDETYCGSMKCFLWPCCVQPCASKILARYLN